MDGSDEGGLGDRPPLVIGDRDQGHFAKSDIERLEIGKVLSAVKSSHRAICHLGKKRKMKLVNVEMQKSAHPFAPQPDHSQKSSKKSRSFRRRLHSCSAETRYACIC